MFATFGGVFVLGVADAMQFLCLFLKSVSVSPLYVSEVLLSFRVTVA